MSDEKLSQEIAKTLNAIATTTEGMERRRCRDLGQFACYQCGAEGPAERCQCDYPQALRCARRYLCQECRLAHAKISVFLAELLRTHPSPNPHSRRAKLHLRLYRALENLPEGEKIRHFIAQTDAADDRFSAVIFRAFVRASFLDFAGLSRGLQREQDRELMASLIRTIRLP